MAEENKSDIIVHVCKEDLVRNIGLYAEDYRRESGKMPDFAILDLGGSSVLSYFRLLHSIKDVGTTNRIKLPDAYYVVGVEIEKEFPHYIPILGVNNLPINKKRETRQRFSRFQIPIGFARTSFWGYREIGIYELNVSPGKSLQSRMMR
ncbi:MAG: hypothetical protein WCP89_01375 [archaeon]